jgi:hypothetical protein
MSAAAAELDRFLVAIIHRGQGLPLDDLDSEQFVGAARTHSHAEESADVINVTKNSEEDIGDELFERYVNYEGSARSLNAQPLHPHDNNSVDIPRTHSHAEDSEDAYTQECGDKVVDRLLGSAHLSTLDAQSSSEETVYGVMLHEIDFTDILPAYNEYDTVIPTLLKASDSGPSSAHQQDFIFIFNFSQGLPHIANWKKLGGTAWHRIIRMAMRGVDLCLFNNHLLRFTEEWAIDLLLEARRGYLADNPQGPYPDSGTVCSL